MSLNFSTLLKFAAVAVSGAYSDLTGTPTIPSTLVQLDTTVTGAQLNADHSLVNGGSPSLASIKDTNGVTVLTFTPGATPVNNWLLNNSPTNPVLTVTGTGTNIAPILRPKGTSKVTIQNGSDTTKAIAFDTSNVTSGQTRNVALPDADILVAGQGALAQTFSGARINPRLSTTVTTSPLAPSVATADLYTVTALANTMVINAPGGTPVDGNRLRFRFKDNGTPQTLTWNAIFRAMGTTIPTTTVANKTLYVEAVFDSADTKWDVTGVNQEA